MDGKNPKVAPKIRKEVVPVFKMLRKEANRAYVNPLLLFKMALKVLQRVRVSHQIVGLARRLKNLKVLM